MSDHVWNSFQPVILSAKNNVRFAIQTTRKILAERGISCCRSSIIQSQTHTAWHPQTRKDRTANSGFLGRWHCQKVVFFFLMNHFYVRHTDVYLQKAKWTMFCFGERSVSTGICNNLVLRYNQRQLLHSAGLHWWCSHFPLIYVDNIPQLYLLRYRHNTRVLHESLSGKIMVS